MTDSTIKIKPLTKKELCLTELLKRGAIGLTQLEAFALYGETCLHSSISMLANNHDLTIKRESEPHTHQYGGKVYFTRYSLPNDKEINKARHLLLEYEVKRGIVRGNEALKA